MRSGGTGGANTNKNGLAFEKKTSLRDSLVKAGMTVSADGHVFRDSSEPVGVLVGQRKLEKWLASVYDANMSEVLSARMFPDEALYSYKTNTLHIIEKKWQEVEGSVDEKVQTCGYKLHQYRKLAAKANMQVTYSYLFNDWWKNKKYDDVKDYMQQQGVNYYFNSIPLSALDI